MEAPLLNMPDRALSAARMKVGRAAWAAKYYRTYDRETVLRIAEAVARAGHERLRTTLTGRCGKPALALSNTRR